MNDKIRLKQKLVEDSIQRRSRIRRNDISLLTALFLAAVIVIAHFSGQAMGYQQGHLNALYTDSKTTQTVDIGEYTVRMHDPDSPAMNDRIGFTSTLIDGDINIQDGMSPTTTYETCVHEHLHDLGIRSKDHNWINYYEGQLVDPLCLKLLYRLNATEKAP